MSQDACSVVLVEPNPDGHRLSYIRLLASVAMAEGRPVVIVTTPRATASTEWRLHLAGLEATVEELPAADFTLSRLATVSERTRARVTVIPDADRFLAPALVSGWRGTGRLSLLAMRPDGQSGGHPVLRPLKGIVKKALIIAASARPRVRVSALRSPLASRLPILGWVADPITLAANETTVSALRRRLESTGPAFWIGVHGVITTRKNLPIVAEALLGRTDVGLLIAGEVEPAADAEAREMIDAFRAQGGSVIRLESPLDDTTFDSAICAVDAVVIAHSNEGSSGVAAKAAAAGRHLIFAGARSLRRDARALPGQATWSPLDAAHIGAAVDMARTAPQPPRTVTPAQEPFTRSLLWA